MSPIKLIKAGLAKGYVVEVTMNSAARNYEILIRSANHVDKFNVPKEDVTPEELGRVLWKNQVR